MIIAAPFVKAAGVGAGLVSLGVDRYRERKAAASAPDAARLLQLKTEGAEVVAARERIQAALASKLAAASETAEGDMAAVAAVAAETAQADTVAPQVDAARLSQLKADGTKVVAARQSMKAALTSKLAQRDTVAPQVDAERLSRLETEGARVVAARQNMEAALASKLAQRDTVAPQPVVESAGDDGFDCAQVAPPSLDVTALDVPTDDAAPPTTAEIVPELAAEPAVVSRPATAEPSERERRRKRDFGRRVLRRLGELARARRELS